MKQFFEKQIEALEKKMEESPRDPVLHKELGNLFYRTEARFGGMGGYQQAMPDARSIQGAYAHTDY